MPQEFHVIRCFECETFQVHIVKKSKKWECKMCGAKQSLKKVYFCGPAKDCRLHVQSLNEQRIVTDSYRNCNNENNHEEQFEENNIQLDPQQSKWNEYLVEDSDNSEPDLENCGMTFERQSKRRKYNKNEDNSNKRMKKIPFDDKERIMKPDYKNEEISNNENYNLLGNNQEKIVKQSKWNSFVIEEYEDDNNSQKYENISPKTRNFLKHTKNKETIPKESKWNCFVTEENENNNEENLQETYNDLEDISQENFVKSINNQDNILKHSKWNYFITKEHEDNNEEKQERVDDFENEEKSNQYLNKSLFSQLHPADEDSLDFLNID